MTIEIIRDPRHPTTHSVAKVIVRGRVYAVTCAGLPTKERVREWWKKDRKSFLPYDESTGVYCGK